MDKQTQALKLALPDRRAVTAAGDPEDYINSGWNDCLDAIRKALAEQPAQQQEPVDVVWFEDNNGASRKSPKDCQSFGANGVPAAVWVNGVRYTSPQPAQQEPVAEVRLIRTGGNAGLATHIVQIVEGYFPAGTKLYTSPQPSKPWVGLMDEERDAILNREFKQWWSRHDAVCRAIEAKLKELNQ